MTQQERRRLFVEFGLDPALVDQEQDQERRDREASIARRREEIRALARP